MKDIWIVARWELLRSIRSKAFLVATVVVPLLMIFIITVPQFFAAQKEKVLLIVDETGAVHEEMIEFLSTQGVKGTRVDLTMGEVEDDAAQPKSEPYLFIPGNFFETKKAYIFFRNSSPVEQVGPGINMVLNQLSQLHNLRNLGVAEEKITELVRPVVVEPVLVAQQTKNMEELIMNQVGLVVFAFLVVFSSMMAGGILLQSIISEKTDRIVEILFSSVSSRDLMAGKILGTVFLGLIQMLVLAAIGITAAEIATDFPLEKMINFNLIYLFIYSVLAFVMNISLYAFLGAIMKEAQSGGQTQPLLGILPVVPMWFLQSIIEDPFGPVARVLSFIPPCTPMTMMMRIAMAPVPLWEILLSMVVLLGFDILLVFFVARIFKTGLLMYGKSAGFKEAFRWFKQAG